MTVCGHRTRSSQLATYLIATTTANEEDDDWSELHIAAITSNITNIRELLAQGEELTPHPGTKLLRSHSLILRRLT